jgi:hypothetical protein
MSFYLHEVGSQERHKQLSRYIVAYDGDISTTINEKTTHILCGEETTAQVRYHTLIIFQNTLISVVCVQKLPDISISSGVVVVSVSWLEDCLKRGTILDTADYNYSSSTTLCD